MLNQSPGNGERSGFSACRGVRIPMKGGRGRGSTPSYKEALANREKNPLEDVRETGVEGKKSTEEGIEEPIEKDQNCTKDKEVEDKK